jgi:DNA-binding transcriptional MocR family regulator
MNVAALAPLPAELSTTPRVDAVVEQIARAIEKGRVVPGDVLPGQRRLAEQLGGTATRAQPQPGRDRRPR